MAQNSQPRKALKELEKSIRRKDKALDLGAATIQSFRAALELHRKKAKSDAALIESMNRHIAALEGKAAAQAETMRDLNGRLEILLAAYAHTAVKT